MIDAISRHRARLMSWLARPSVALATHASLIVALMALATLPGEAIEAARDALALNPAIAVVFGGVVVISLVAWRVRGWRVPWFVDTAGMIYAVFAFFSFVREHPTGALSSADSIALALVALVTGVFALALLSVPTPWEPRPSRA